MSDFYEYIVAAMLCITLAVLIAWAIYGNRRDR